MVEKVCFDLVETFAARLRHVCHEVANTTRFCWPRKYAVDGDARASDRFRQPAWHGELCGLRYAA